MLVRVRACVEAVKMYGAGGGCGPTREHVALKNNTARNNHRPIRRYEHHHSARVSISPFVFHKFDWGDRHGSNHFKQQNTQKQKLIMSSPYPGARLLGFFQPWMG